MAPLKIYKNVEKNNFQTNRYKCCKGLKMFCEQNSKVCDLLQSNIISMPFFANGTERRNNNMKKK